MPSDDNLAGRVALVTGASRGIGRAIAFELARCGARVAVNYRSRSDSAEAVVSRIHAVGGSAISVKADVADKAQVEEMVALCESELGPVDILVNNAGLLYLGRLMDHRESEFDQMWRTNVKGVVYATAAVAPRMIERGGGRVVNVSSIAALGTSSEGTTMYAATKAAVLSLTKRSAFELGRHGIKVNAVLPGFVKTEMVFGGKSDEEAAEIEERVGARAMLRRIGRPEDIASVVRFLCSPDADFMTGQCVVADGGRIDYFAQ